MGLKISNKDVEINPIADYRVNKNYKYGSNINKNSEEIYNKEKKARQNRKNNLTSEQISFLLSIFELQVKLGLNDLEFCELLEIKSKRTLDYWRYLHGVFPSNKVLNRIKLLKAEDNIIIVIKSNKIEVIL